MIVCIAEKPSVGKDIAKVLGATQDHRNYWEGNGYQVTWTFGHLCELKEPHSALESVEPFFITYDSSPLRHQAKKRQGHRRTIPGD